MRGTPGTMIVSETQWVDAQGVAHPLRRMDTSYILNCIQFLARKRKTLIETMLTFGEGDNVVALRQVELWDIAIEQFFTELRRRGRQ